MPDMSKVKKSKLQKLQQTDFAKVVAYAQSIIRDKKKKEKYAKTIEEGKTVYLLL
jgi:hypothetical protein